MRLLFVAEGDAETRDCWSGCALGFVEGLRSRGAEVQTVNLELTGWRKYWVAARTYGPSRPRWAWRFRLGEEAFRHRSLVGAEALGRLGGDWDAIIQAGAPALLPRRARGQAPYVIYCDANLRFAERGRPYSGITSLDQPVLDRIAEREHRVYDEATRIWTWSQALSTSFVQDFGQPESKVHAIHAGANLELHEADPRSVHCPGADSPPPSVLFVGKDYNRKGLNILTEAFQSVREQVPGAVLHVVGGAPDWARGPGVHLHGFVPASTPEGAEKLRTLYREATVFCLPTRYEPFGVSFVEAMLAELPCIGTTRWAMPEIIEDGKTGWLVPDGDARALAQVLTLALTDREASLEMGRRGRSRALAWFTWERVAARAIEDLEGMLGDERRGVGD